MAREIFLRKMLPILGKLSAIAFFCGGLSLSAGNAALAAPDEAAAVSKPRFGRSTGLPIPRFASVKADPSRLRKGPGVDYPILWEISRRGLPVRIIGEYGHWRRVELHDGARGWMHRVLLSGRRTALLLGDRPNILSEPYKAAAPVAQIGSVTPLRLENCVRGWCAVEGSGVRGWAPIQQLWGADPSHGADGF